MTMNPVIITFILIFFSSTCNANNTAPTLQTVKEGLDAGKAILDALKDSSNSASITKLAAVSGSISPFLGAVGPVLSFVTMFYPSPEITLMKQEFRQLNHKIDRVFYDLGEVRKLIEKTSLKLQYYSYEHTILSLSSKLRDYLDSDAKNAATFKKIFVNEYKNSFNGAAQKLYDGMMANGKVFSLDIPYTAIKFTNYHRRRTQNIMKGTLNLIIQGVKVTLAYHKAEGISDSDYEALSNVWDEKIKTIIEHIGTKDVEVKNAWHGQLTKDVDSKLKQYGGRSNQDFSERLYKFLTDKYDWRSWLVVVYNPIWNTRDTVDNSKYYWYFCDGLQRMRQNGRSTLIASVDNTKQAISQSTTKSRFHLNYLCYYTQGWWGRTGSYTCSGAKGIYKAQKQLLRGCSMYASVGVIKDGNGLAIKGTPERLVSEHAGESTIYAFG